jgi:putative tryptophan/tyrosine transport system substrate-binding protein
MNRRDIMALLGGAAAWPVTARAQQPAIPVIAFVNGGSADGSADVVSAFRKGLGEAGYVEGRNVTVEYHWLDGQYDRVPALMADLVRRQVAVIATPGSTPVALAAKAATTTIPIVYGGGGDPVQAGLVATLNRPGGNVTGYTEINFESASKRLNILHDLVPAASRFVLLIETNSAGLRDFADLRSAASAMGLTLEPLVVPVDEVDAALAGLARKQVDAAIVSPSALFHDHRAEFTAAAARHAIPVIYWDRSFAEAGGLISYGSSVTEMFHQVGSYAGRILKGEKPPNMPVIRATKFELVINLKTAKTLGLTIPPGVLATADEVIE